MKRTSKIILGQKSAKILIPIPKKDFSELDKHQIIQDYYTSGKSKREIWEKYTGQKTEHGVLLRWMRQLGYEHSAPIKNINFASSNASYYMSKNTTPKNTETESFEIQQLKKRITELELRLKESDMKAIAFSTMVDIAEREFNISIRKKYSTKPSKK